MYYNLPLVPNIEVFKKLTNVQNVTVDQNYTNTFFCVTNMSLKLANIQLGKEYLTYAHGTRKKAFPITMPAADAIILLRLLYTVKNSIIIL